MTQTQQPADWRKVLQEKALDLRTEELVDRLLGLLQDPASMTFVGHQSPDDDVLLCFWIGKKFIPGAAKARIAFVNAGETLPGSDGDPTVYHFDTGKGEFDQHGKGLKRTASAQMLAEKLGVHNDPGLKPLLDMVTAVDNMEPLPATSIHYAIEGYRRLFKKEDGSTNWDTVMERTFELFTIVYGQETQRVQSRKQLDRHATVTALPNGIRIATILWSPQLREAAFERGAWVVVWTSALMRHEEQGIVSWSEFNRARKTKYFNTREWKQVFYAGIQVHRAIPLYLDRVAQDLMLAEAKKRNVYLETLPSVWFLHDSKKLIMNGSETHEPVQDEFTRLSPTDIVGTVVRTLVRIPPEITSRWSI